LDAACSILAIAAALALCASSAVAPRASPLAGRVALEAGPAAFVPLPASCTAMRLLCTTGTATSFATLSAPAARGLAICDVRKSVTCGSGPSRVEAGRYKYRDCHL